MPVRSLGLCVLLVVAACSVPGGEEAPVEAAVWCFDDAHAGTLPPGLTASVGAWTVVQDSTAPSGDRVLAQLERSPGPDFNVVLLDGVSRQAVDVSVAFRSIAGEIDQGGGLVWRAKDARNYYIARYNPLEDNYRVYEVVEGQRQQLQSADLGRTPGWHTLRVTMAGDLIRCFHDGEPFLEVRDTTFTEAGRIGLWTKADAQTHFDDLTVH